MNALLPFPHTRRLSPRLAPLLLAGAVAASHAWPSRAWPEAAAPISLAYCLVAAWGAAALWQSKTRLALDPLLWGALWTACVLAGAWQSYYSKAGVECGSQAVAGFLVFLAAASWTALAASPEAASESRTPLLRNPAATILIGALALTAAGMAVHVIWQRYVGYAASLRAVEEDPLAVGGPGALREAILYELRSKRPGSAFGAPNLAAAFLALGAALAAGLAVAAKRRRAWLLAGPPVALCLFAGALTQSRGGALTFAAGAVGAAILARRFRSRAGGSRRKRMAAALAAAAIL
ncbi:MAG: hypothetical protein NTW86_22970, partial [Candidatus Sumerlaeota bacterium]|nr:hypothetical protein [Candidatus Sumerlaeota bacterium]